MVGKVFEEDVKKVRKILLYTYQKNIKIGKNAIVAVCGVKENKSFLEKFAYIAEWFSIGFLFYLNSAFIHSRLFSIFVFIFGLMLLFTLNFERKLSSKEEFLQKVDEILGDEE